MMARYGSIGHAAPGLSRLLGPEAWAGGSRWQGCYSVAVPVRRVAEPQLPLKVAFGRAVGRLRVRFGYSIDQLGARAGLSPADVLAVEHGDRNLPLATVERLAQALGVRVSELLADAERLRRR